MRAPIAAVTLAAVLAMTAGSAGSAEPGGQAKATTTITIRGKQQTLRTFGTRGSQPVLVSSSDGGWVRLAPIIAAALASRGFFVVGFDSKAYLSSFTAADSTLRETDIPGDYRPVIDFAASGSASAPILVGVSEGAGLSVLAATRDDVKQKVRGVIAIGLPDKTELGWRWRDSMIYITHGTPNEPTFDTDSLIGRVSPLPLAVIHSTNDPFVPLEAVKAMLAHAKEPKRLWTIASSDHRFSDNEAEFQARLLEALEWVKVQKPPGD